MRAIGVFGGTFDPVHIAHIRGAIDCLETLRLDEVRLMPAASPPLKTSVRVSAQHRAAMLSCAVQAIDGLTVDTRELRRSGPSYTVDTLVEMRRELGEPHSLTFILGLDSLVNLHRWHDWRRLFDVANIAIMARPGVPTTLDHEVQAYVAARECPAAQLHQVRAGALAYVGQPALELSSTAIRTALANGNNVQFLLPEPVIEYIVANELYELTTSSRRGG